MKQWNHAYIFSKIALIIILGLLNLVLNVEKSDTIMALTGIILIVCCAHEMLVDLNLKERDRSEWGINVVFVLLEIVIGLLACLLLVNWYNALIIYIIMRPYNKWFKRIRILLPSVGYLIQLQYVASKSEPVITKFREFFLLIIICLGLYYLEKFLLMYEKKENLILEAVKHSVLNELYTKNISKELAEQVLVVEEGKCKTTGANFT